MLRNTQQVALFDAFPKYAKSLVETRLPGIGCGAGLGASHSLGAFADATHRGACDRTHFVVPHDYQYLSETEDTALAGSNPDRKTKRRATGVRRICFW